MASVHEAALARTIAMAGTDSQAGGVPLLVTQSVQGVGFTNTMQLTQAQYDALAVKDAAVMYVIVG